MKIIEQSHEIIDRNIDPLKLIELCGRVCYKTEDKITDDSSKKFVGMLVKRGHLSVIEHATACYKVSNTVMYDIRNSDRRSFIAISNIDGIPVISGNLRALKEFSDDNLMYHGAQILHDRLVFDFPWLFHHKDPIHGMYINGRRPNKNSIYPAITEVRHPFTRYHYYETVRFITNRGVTHELVRHRPATYSQESTRYVNYGGSEMQFIKPVWFTEEYSGIGKRTDAEFVWEKSIIDQATDYKKLINLGWRPEQAREVLPNSLKTEIVMTATLDEWRHVFAMRCQPAAHPQIRALMLPVLKDFNDKWPKVYCDLAEKYLQEDV